MSCWCTIRSPDARRRSGDRGRIAAGGRPVIRECRVSRRAGLAPRSIVPCVLAVMLVTGCAMPMLGLQAEDPLPATGLVVGSPELPVVDSLQPTLRWQAFPRPEDRRTLGEAAVNRVSNVTYDLRIWWSWHCQVWPDSPFDVDGHDTWYSRDGLTRPFHRIEAPLKPSGKYCWTVRARFTIDGHPRMTEWSRQGLPAFNEIHLYGFRAPAAH